MCGIYICFIHTLVEHLQQRVMQVMTRAHIAVISYTTPLIRHKLNDVTCRGF